MFSKYLKYLTQDTLVYGIAGALSKFMSLLTIPIITRVMSKEQFGSMDIVLSFSLILGGLIISGQDSSIARFLFEKNDSQHRKKVVTTGLLIECIGFLFITIFLTFFHNILGNFFFNNNKELNDYWTVSLLSLPGSVLLNSAVNLFKWTFNKKHYLIISLGSTITFSVGTIIFIPVLQMGVLGGILAQITAFSIFGFGGLFLLKDYIDLRFLKESKILFKEMFVYGIPFTASALLSSFIPSMDRFFLIRYTTVLEVGIYAVGMKSASIMRMIIYAFQVAFGPQAFSILSKENSSLIIPKLFKAYIFIGGLILIIFAGFGDLLIRFIGSKKYSASLIVFLPILVAFFFQGLLEFNILGLIWAKKSSLNFFVILAGIILTIVFNWILTPKLLILGPAISLILSNFLMNIMAYNFSRRLSDLKFNYSHLWVVLFCSAIVFCLVYLDYFNISLFYYFAKISAVLVIPCVMFFILYKKQERDIIFGQLRKFVQRIRTN